MFFCELINRVIATMYKTGIYLGEQLVSYHFLLFSVFTQLNIHNLLNFQEFGKNSPLLYNPCELMWIYLSACKLQLLGLFVIFYP